MLFYYILGPKLISFIYRMSATQNCSFRRVLPINRDIFFDNNSIFTVNSNIKCKEQYSSNIS